MSTFQLKNYKISDNILCDNYKKYTSRKLTSGGRQHSNRSFPGLSYWNENFVFLLKNLEFNQVKDSCHYSRV